MADLGQAEFLSLGSGLLLVGRATVVATYVAYLRRKLARYGPDLIHTQRAVGYSLWPPRPGDAGPGGNLNHT